MNRDARGFTLVEILAAVAVLAIALSAILAGMAQYANGAARIRQKTVALWVAHNRLAEVTLQGAVLQTGTSDGDVDMAGTAWTWRMEVLPTPDQRLSRVNLDVLLKDDETQGVLASLSAFVDSGKR